MILPTAGSYDNLACYDPCVKVYDGIFYLVYSAFSSGASIGFATSTDGINWTKKGAVVTQSGGASEPSLVRIGNRWYISHDIYTNGASREIFGSWWDGESHVVTQKILAKGQAEWKSASVFDSSLFYANGKLYLHYAGGNVATPNQGLNANIGISVAQV